MKNLRYERMFFYEDLFAKHGDLHRLESMDYDTRVFKMPKAYKRAIDLMFEHHTLTYSDFGGIKRFKDLVLKYEQSLTGISCDECGTFVGTGVSSLIFPTIEAILNLPENKNRKEIILFSPDYTLFHSSVQYAGGVSVMVYSKREHDYLPTIESIAAAITSDTAAILFANPNNPTCKNYSEKWVAELVKLAKQNNLFIISDEMYFYTVYKGEFTHIPRVSGSYHNYAKLYGLSKDRPGTTGMRTGYYIGDKRLIDYISDSQLVRNFSGNINADFIFLVDIALRYLARTGEKFSDLKWFTDEEITDYSQTINDNTTLQKASNAAVVAALKENKNVIDLIEPDCGNAVFFRYHRTLPATDLAHEFVRKGIALYPCDVFNLDPEKEGSWSRICVTKSIDFLKEGIQKL